MQVRSRLYGNIWSAAMGVLLVVCPNARQKFSTGVQIERSDLGDMAADTTLSAFCPYCKKTHKYRYGDAEYVDSIPPKDWIENR
jgi:hypothetical protein